MDRFSEIEGKAQPPIRWFKAAEKDFGKFPTQAQLRITAALEVAAVGRKADIAKPMKGFTDQVFEVALKHRGNAYRTVYAVKLENRVWVLHAFQKKSKKGIETPKQEIEKIKTRLKAAKEIIKDEQERRH